MNDDRAAFECAYALCLARKVDPDLADLIVDAAEAGLIEIRKAIDLVMQLTQPTSERNDSIMLSSRPQTKLLVIIVTAMFTFEIRGSLPNACGR